MKKLKIALLLFAFVFSCNVAYAGGSTMQPVKQEQKVKKHKKHHKHRKHKKKKEYHLTKESIAFVENHPDWFAPHLVWDEEKQRYK